MRTVCSVILGIIVIAAARPAAAQTAGFVTRLGNDTVAVERFTRSANRLAGEIVSRAPQVLVRSYTTDFGADGRATRSEVALRRAGETVPYQTSVATFTRDSVMTETRRDTTVIRRRVAIAGSAVAVPAGPNVSWAITELLTERLRASREDSVVFPAYLVGSTAGFTIVWTRVGRDSIISRAGDGVWRGKLTSEGRLQAVRPIAGTQLFSTERVAAPDVQALATAWGARERQATQAGPLSPRDTVRASVAGASLLVDYGRPSKRGRELFGSPIAPWGEVWRTGANAATQFRTDKDLEMGGVVLSAGFYTLWTIPSPTGWKLLINSQTGQWGTAHDATKDIFQLPMTTTTLPQSVERFTISVTPGGQGGTLILEWDTVRASIPFTVRP